MKRARKQEPAADRPPRLHRPDDGSVCTVYSGNGRRLGDVATVAEAYRCLYLWLNASIVMQSGEVILRHEDWRRDPP